MKSRMNKPAYTAAAIAAVTIAAVFFIFFTDNKANQHQSNVTLPESGGEKTPAADIILPYENDDNGKIVEISAANVLSVIRTIQRPAQYYMELETSVYSSGKALTTSVKYWVKDGQSITRREKAGEAAATYTMCTQDTVKIWHENSDDVYSTFRSRYSGDDIAGIMTYEDILTSSDKIVSAKYTDVDDYQYIYIIASDNELLYIKEYYIDVNSGLLLHSRISKSDELIYSMDTSVLSEDISDMDSLFVP